MKTNHLIAMLAAEASATPAVSPLRRCAQATAAGIALSLALVLTLWGLNPELNTLAHTPAFWVKVVWLALMCVFAAPVVMHLARPGVAAGKGMWGIVAALAGIALLALMQVATVDADTGMQLMLGRSWQECSASIAALSVPLLATLLWMLRGMAPTRPAFAGASAGLMAGAMASLVYSLHCTETAYAFVAVWYVAGIAVMTGVGALLGSRLLRW